MSVGIIGVGVVGGAVQYGFEKLGHAVVVHDLRLDTKIEDVLMTESVYICVPTPEKKDGTRGCDTANVEGVINALCSAGYNGDIIIKSTVEPGFTEAMCLKFKTNKIGFCPEFLRERAAIADFQEMDLLIVGTSNQDLFDRVVGHHGKYPKKVIKLTPSEAELAKYFNNIYNATLITFANSFFEVCKLVGADYSAIKNAIVNRDHITDIYLDCNENFRGFGGVCLPKDTAAIANLMKDSSVEFFKDLLKENAKYKITVFDGMRK